MVQNAQSDNEKASLMYQVELFKDKLEDMEEAHSLLQVNTFGIDVALVIETELIIVFCRENIEKSIESVKKRSEKRFEYNKSSTIIGIFLKSETE